MLDVNWFLPTYGDSRGIVGGGHGQPARTASKDRPATLSYLSRIATAADDLGFEGLLVPTGAWCEDAWVTAAMLAAITERIKFLIALRPGAISPTLAAQMASTFQWQSRGRLLLNVVTGGESHEQRAYGDHEDKASRYARCDEFLRVVNALWQSEKPVSFRGAYFDIEDATLQRLPDPRPPLYFGGSSGPAGPVFADNCDVYLTWGEPPAAVRRKVEWIRGLAEERGRTVEFGIRLHVITRDTSAAAWAEAQRLLDGVSPEQIARVQAGLRRSESEGQQRMLELNRGTKDGLEVSPNLWAGVGLVRGGAGTALVGSHTEVADRLEEYAELGLTKFVLSGYPHLEEAYWFGEGVLPILEERGLWKHPGRPGAAPVSHVPFAAAI
ncbi:LLM class flavin-dependent oxidoreductase [Raineyella fluvialis]|uniref:LLM class flavin-dependent oxidoreductase n=1 Tax=Raineyella fluvialis TaxID=2662261 RepID=A0A5Q2FEF1_9ACTN|nr:LLM class flavin-dependent oxidoreductase [Raineyella fluvialis]QGF24761.1 LLM class flavin-dependent oxidoreductase [Raineyella fluvialis]